jgi:hypothetical protein
MSYCELFSTLETKLTNWHCVQPTGQALRGDSVTVQGAETEGKLHKQTDKPVCLYCCHTCVCV